MAKYKNITENELTVPGIGIVKPGETVEAPEGFHNVNFEKIEERKKQKEEEEIKNK